MNTKQLKQIIKEEVQGVLSENEDAPKGKSPKEIAEFIKDKIKQYMDEDDIVGFIQQAIAAWAKRQQRLGFYKNAKIDTMVFNITQYNEDYIPDVFDELQQLGVKYDRLGSMRKKNPSQYEKLAKDSPEFIKKYSENKNMNKLDLRNIVKEEIQSVLVNEVEKIDYTDRNAGFTDAAIKLEKLKNEMENLDIKERADIKVLEYRYSRLAPMAADVDGAIDKINLFIKFLTQDNSRILNTHGSVR